MIEALIIKYSNKSSKKMVGASTIGGELVRRYLVVQSLLMPESLCFKLWGVCQNYSVVFLSHHFKKGLLHFEKNSKIFADCLGVYDLRFSGVRSFFTLINATRCPQFRSYWHRTRKRFVHHRLHITYGYSRSNRQVHNSRKCFVPV